jgi:hypothetical protein
MCLLSHGAGCSLDPSTLSRESRGKPTAVARPGCRSLAAHRALSHSDSKRQWRLPAASVAVQNVGGRARWLLLAFETLTGARCRRD